MVAMVSPRFTRSLVSTIHAVSLCRRLGLLSCLSTWPHELADMAGTRPQVVTMSLNTVPPVDCKCAAAAAGLSSRLALSERFVAVLSTPLEEQPVLTHHCPLTTAHLWCAAFRNDLERIKASLGLPKYTSGPGVLPLPLTGADPRPIPE